MSESSNVQVVKDAYAAFQQGDIDGVLRLVVDDVDWHGVKGAEDVAPQAGARKGRAAVGEFSGCSRRPPSSRTSSRVSSSRRAIRSS
jgi:ketosteroid isomerase-like protein